MRFLRLSLFSIPLHELGKVKHRWFRQHCPLHCVQCARIPLYPIYTLAVSTPTRLFVCFFFCSPRLLFTYCLLFSLFFFIFNAADKEVDDYYTRKRHLPDLAARGTLPLHVLKLSQEQVGT